MRSFTAKDYEELFEFAEKSDIKRAHKLLHSSHDDKVQRLLIALCKGSFVVPHYHELPNQWEMFIVLQGELLVKLYDINNKNVISEHIFSSSDILELNPKEVHSVECTSGQALLLEVKEGPFSPEFAKVFL